MTYTSVHILFCFYLFQIPVYGNSIIFENYCTNSSNPSPLPTHGEMSSGSIVMSTVKDDKSPWYEPDMNCSMTLETENNFHILLTFSNVSLRNSSMDNLTVVFNDDNSDAILAGQQVCSNENCQGLMFESGKFSNITLKFLSANVSVPLNVTGFKAHYTVYDLVNDKTGACRGKERFLCENRHCIWYALTCDGHNDCGDLSDETKCIIPTKNVVWGILTIFAAFVSVIVFVPLFILLATFGTRSIVKIVTLPNQATPLLNAAEGGDGSGILTSSEAYSNCWPGTSYDGSSYSVSYGTTSEASNQKHSKSDQNQQPNKFL